MKKVPKLATLLVPLADPKPRPKAMPWQQQMATFRQIMEAKRK